jgi:hypothetical protein
MTFTLTDRQVSTLYNALTVAADQYERDAKLMTEVGSTSVAVHFINQASDARALAEEIEGARIEVRI